MENLPLKIDTIDNKFVVTEVESGKVICICPSLTGLNRCIIGLATFYGGGLV